MINLVKNMRLALRWRSGRLHLFHKSRQSLWAVPSSRRIPSKTSIGNQQNLKYVLESTADKTISFKDRERRIDKARHLVQMIALRSDAQSTGQPSTSQISRCSMTCQSCHMSLKALVPIALATSTTSNKQIWIKWLQGTSTLKLWRSIPKSWNAATNFFKTSDVTLATKLIEEIVRQEGWINLKVARNLTLAIQKSRISNTSNINTNNISQEETK